MTGIPQRNPDIEPVEQRKCAECRIQSVHIRLGTTRPHHLSGDAMTKRCQRVVNNYTRSAPRSPRRLAADELLCWRRRREPDPHENGRNLSGTTLDKLFEAGRAAVPTVHDRGETR